MSKSFVLLEKAAVLRTKAQQATRLAAGLLPGADEARLTLFSQELRERASELERQAAAEVPSRPAEPIKDASKDSRKSKRGRGGSNDPDPQT